MNRITPYSKALAAAITVLLVAVAPDRLDEIAAALGALAVFFVPNRPAE